VAPAVYRASFEVTAPGDTFLDMRTWHKGAAWVNGHSLGRYWSIGPQQTLYLPGCWLTAGRNAMLVLDLTGDAAERTVRGLTQPILDDVRPEYP
jgi:beta-galactosidase